VAVFELSFSRLLPVEVDGMPGSEAHEFTLALYGLAGLNPRTLMNEEK
jgi:hypothetical protein